MTDLLVTPRGVAGRRTLKRLHTRSADGPRISEAHTWPEPVVLAGPGPEFIHAVPVAIDVVALVASAAVSLSIRGHLLEPLSGSALALASGRSLLALLLGWVVLHAAALAMTGLYRPRLSRSAMDEVPRLLQGVALGTVLDVTTAFLLRFDTPRGLIVVAGLASLLFVGLGRGLSYFFVRRQLATAIGGVPTVVVGDGPLASRAVAELHDHPEHGLRVIGVLSDSCEDSDFPETAWLGPVDRLAEAVRDFNVGQVLLTADTDTDATVAAIRRCTPSKAWVSVVNPLPELVSPFGSFDRVGTLPVTHVRAPRRGTLVRLVRDAVDRAVAALILLAVSPVIAVLALLVRLDSHGPAFFRQQRVGRGGKEFSVVKMRTMAVDAEARLAEIAHLNESDGPLFKVREDPRVTKAGRWLRATSLDELPQLWNVVRGDMSLVGPRPALATEVSCYPDWFRRRLDVRPGLTGLWQVQGRADLSFTEAARLDLAYVESWSPWLDIQILFRTVGVMVARKGGY